MSAAAADGLNRPARARLREHRAWQFGGLASSGVLTLDVMARDQIDERSSLVCAPTGGGGEGPEPPEDGDADRSTDVADAASGSSAPLVEHAALAAQAISADEGVRRVVLFGSVAARLSTASSDIDLMVVREDIDYRMRHQEADRMMAVGIEAAGWPVQVLLTDVPELEWRTEHVRSSFENKVLEGSITVVDRPIRPEQVRADKRIGAETSDAGEAASRLGDACETLTAMTAAIMADLFVTSRSRTLWERLHRRHSVTVIRNATMILESAIKSLHHSQLGRWPDKASDPWELAAAVPDGAAKQQVIAILDRLAKIEKMGPTVDELSHTDWRWPGPRTFDVPQTWWHTPRRAKCWATAAVAVAGIALEAVMPHLPDRPDIIDTDQCLAAAQHAVIGWAQEDPAGRAALAH